MKTTNALLAVSFFLGSCILPDLSGSAHAGYMSLTPSGNFALQNSARTNNVDSVRADVEDGLKVDDAGTPFLKGEVNLGDWDVIASGFLFDERSNGTLTADFGNITASPGSPTSVATDLSVYNVKAALAYNLLDFGIFDLSAGVCLNYFSVDMDVQSATAFENLAFDAPAPLLYARATAGVSVVTGKLEVSWLDIDLGDAAGSYFDLDAMVSVNPLPFLEVVAGYRNVVIDVGGEVDNQDFDTHLRLSGWYLGGGVSF
jgi:hypothetical protein